MPTRQMKEQIHCPHCGQWHGNEKSFNRWMRAQPSLDSQFEGIVCFDCDLILHRYFVKYDDGRRVRDLQCIMFVEIKTFDAELSPTQQDTLSIFSQALRNRRPNIHKKKHGRHMGDHSPLTKAWSHMSKKDVKIRMFGAHLLRFENNDPTDGWIEWDNKRISQSELISLLRFETDPDTMKPMDMRIHHKLPGPMLPKME